MAKKQIKDYFFNPGLGLLDNARPNAVSLITQNKIFIIKEIAAFIQNKITAEDPDYSGLIYNSAKYESDAESVVDALVFDLRYNGNEETRKQSASYWNQEVSLLIGNRIPEIQSYTHAITLINDFILTNTLNTNPEQTLAVQIVDVSKITETNTQARVSTLLSSVTNVIENGLGVFPSLVVGLGRIEVLGKVQLEDILIITNATTNVVFYNFAEPTKGGQVRFSPGNSEAYPQAESVNNGTTIINFNFGTQAMSSADSIQIFQEETQLTVRMNDIARDAMERVKVGIPQSMLDADFEYGLQPTKWQALSLQRGYPSTYEIPGSDLVVVTVATDASTGTADIGASLITVTTQGSHNLKIGQPITIRALSTSVLGFNRAEGTFLVSSVPTATSFTYFAKSKVGTANAQILATQNTQLRRAAFYTGAAVGTPTFTVLSNGSNGSFTTSLIAESASNTLSYTGNAPVIGAPLTGTGITPGTQVSGVFGSNNADGIEITKFVKTSSSSGALTIELIDTFDVEAGMVVSNGADPAVQLTITSIVGTKLTLSGPLTVAYVGDDQTYSGNILSAANYVQGTGSAATVDVEILADPGEVDDVFYNSITVNQPGADYQIGDTLFIAGNLLGGLSPDNDLYLNVTGVDIGNLIIAEIMFSISGPPAGAGTFTNIATQQTINSAANNASVAIRKISGGYEFVGLADGGFGFFVGNRFIVLGTSLGGTTPANDATVTISSVVFAGSGMIDFTVTGTSTAGDEIDIYSAISLSAPTTTSTPAGTAVTYSELATIEIEFQDNHGLVPGASILVEIDSDGSNHQLAAGPYFVTQIVDLKTITYLARSAGAIDVSETSLDGSIYIRPDSYFSHRPFDGGVQLSSGGPQHGAQAIRMSKNYIRYQSGKGAMYNTGALFAPSFDLALIVANGTATGSLITVTTDDTDHGLQAGSRIEINGVETVGYDGKYTVNEIVDERNFRIVATSPLGDTTGILGPQCQMSTFEWQGAIVRAGVYDDQNGIFWQYDGQKMAVGLRTSTFTIAGTITIAPNTNTATGVGTRFFDQVQEGDRVVIRGMTHVITHIASNTQMSVSPDFRGVVIATGVKLAKVQDNIIPQSQWNLDRCDGTGPSGYNLDVTYMQMVGIQYTWYGAGFIDWMLRGPNGDYTFCHRLKGNNINTEAYMRSGNLPVRYEVVNEGARNRLRGAIDSSQTTIPLRDVSDFPSSGVVYVDNEIIAYSGINLIDNTLTGASRSASLSNFAGGSTRTYQAGAAASHGDRQGVVLVSNTTSPIISHWGSAYLIDGRFDDDRGFLFNYAGTNIPISTIINTAFLIRLAPSVSNSVIGDLGERELLNRAQLLLSALTVTSDAVTGSGALIIEGVLNPQNYPENPENISWTGLNNPAAGGQPSFAQIALGSSVIWEGGSVEVTSTATIQGVLTTTITAQPVFQFNRSLNNGGTIFYIFDTDFDSSSIAVGDPLSGTGIRTGSVISQVSRSAFQNYTLVRSNLTFTQNVTGTSTVTVTAQNTAASYTNSSFLFFTQASFETSNARVGTAVATSQSQFPANSQIQSIAPRTLGSTTIVRVNFTATFAGTLAAAAAVTFDFTPPPYAQPGETIFSFISNPGDTDTLDLSPLKELTTTALGGRGAFPNGPDVLAINVRKVAGDSTVANVVLRWGEAQA